MTRFRPGDPVLYGNRRGEVFSAWPVGYTGQICAVRFDNGISHWIMADELSLVVERLPFRPRVVGGTDLDTLPSDMVP